MTTDVNDLLTAWTECERTGDARGLDKLLTDDFVGIGPVGFVLDKRAWLGRLGPDLRYEHLELDEVSTRHHGSTAMVVAHQHAVGTARGNRVPPDTRVSFTVVTDDDAGLRIAGIAAQLHRAAAGGPVVSAEAATRGRRGARRVHPRRRPRPPR
jgi:Domain of unknown function (DUF4440)